MSGAPTHNTGKAQGTFRRSKATQPGRPADPVLFDVAQTTDQPCPAPHCGAIRLAGQERAPTCVHDLDPESRKRPRGCLNAIDPATAPFPEGF